MDRSVLSYEDGRIIGNTALDAISDVTERWTDASLILVRVELVIEAEGQLHEVVRIARRTSHQDLSGQVLGGAQQAAFRRVAAVGLGGGRCGRC